MRIRVVAMVLTAVVASICSPLYAQGASDEQAIRSLMALTTDAFNKHDAKA